MPPSAPFVDPETGSIDTAHVLDEAIPLAKLVALFGVLGYAPLALLAVAPLPGGGLVLTLASQFVLAVGAGVVLIYAISRALQLSGE